MSIEIRFPAAEAPGYLDTIVFARKGDQIVIQIVHGERNIEKARYEIDAVRFNQMVDILLSEPST